MNYEEKVKKLRDEVLRICKDNKYNMKFIEEGLNCATELHKIHVRKSGEPYIVHPLSVAIEIAKLDLGEDSVVAAFMHDTIEDCEIDKDYISEKFNPEVAKLVEGVTKLDELADNSLKRYTEILTLRKFLISTSDDIRVLLIKLADRLHNMRTIDGLSERRQIEYSEETLKVYVPLAEYIGIGKWKRELEDISFKKHNSDIYNIIKIRVEQDHRVYDKIVDKLIFDVEKILKAHNVKYDQVYGRIKSVHSIYKKIFKQLNEGKIPSAKDWNISSIKDLVAISIIIKEDDLMECYKVLGLIHSNFDYFPKELDDYIAKPKKNGYRALQTTIKYKSNTTEDQIKTAAMHDINEYGSASHIAYKLSGKRNASATSHFQWIKNLNQWRNNQAKEEKNFSLDIFANSIFVITPKGRVIELTKGSTPIDFAYHIHSEIGNRYTGVKINNQIGKIDSILQNGDLVEILTSKSPKKPSPEWLNLAHSTSTKSKIRRALLLQEREETINKGKIALNDYVNSTLRIDWLTLDSGVIKYVIGEFGFKDIDSFYISFSNNNVSKKDVIKILIKKLNLQRTSANTSTEEVGVESQGKIAIEGDTDLEYKLAGCCRPLKGDEIVGVVTLMNGLKIHRDKCPSIDEISDNRRLKANWVLINT